MQQSNTTHKRNTKCIRKRVSQQRVVPSMTVQFVFESSRGSARGSLQLQHTPKHDTSHAYNERKRTLRTACRESRCVATEDESWDVMFVSGRVGLGAP